MQIKVKVIPKSSMNLVETEIDGTLKVKLTSAPEKGKANQKLVEVLAEHYNVKKSAVTILKGHKSKIKLVDVNL